MTQTQQAPAPDKAGKEVLVNVVLDRSGSMESCRSGTISGYNEYLKGLKADKETKYSVSLIQFDAPHVGPELTVSYADKPLADVPDLNSKTYEPRGMTPLYDAVGECVRRVESKGRAVITVIITDGLENASKEFTQESIKKLIKEKEAEGWTFTFLGADIDSYHAAGAMGVAAGNVSNYVRGDEHNLYANLANATMERCAAVRSHGLVAASAMAFVSPTMRSSLEHTRPAPPIRPTRPGTTGGRPPAPRPFQKPAERKPRNWTVKSGA